MNRTSIRYNTWCIVWKGAVVTGQKNKIFLSTTHVSGPSISSTCDSFRPPKSCSACPNTANGQFRWVRTNVELIFPSVRHARYPRQWCNDRSGCDRVRWPRDLFRAHARTVQRKVSIVWVLQGEIKCVCEDKWLTWATTRATYWIQCYSQWKTRNCIDRLFRWPDQHRGIIHWLDRTEPRIECIDIGSRLLGALLFSCWICWGKYLSKKSSVGGLICYVMANPQFNLFVNVDRWRCLSFGTNWFQNPRLWIGLGISETNTVPLLFRSF